jgi:hypothetical protein
MNWSTDMFAVDNSIDAAQAPFIPRFHNSPRCLHVRSPKPVMSRSSPLLLERLLLRLTPDPAATER